MSLNSWQFCIFALVAIVIYQGFANLYIRKLILIVFSCWFLCSYLHSAQSLFVLFLFLLVVYGLGVVRQRSGIAWPAFTSVTTIIGLWGFLFMAKDNSLLGSLNPFYRMPILIIGISYMVFRAMSYLIEVGDIKTSPLSFLRKSGFIDYLNYMLFFPAILAGPIERYKRFISQVNQVHRNEEDILPSLHRVANGFIKKYVLADNLLLLSASGISDPASSTPLVLWIGAVIQLFIVYLDFSGYCDIVIGIARLMGFKMVENFDHPFTSKNVQEFWERWHVSMGSIMRDYIFTPIVKFVLVTAKSKWHWPLVTTAYFFVMILIALWHGTTSGFFIFGLTQACALVAIQISLQRKKEKGRNIGMPTNDILRYTGKTLTVATTYIYVSFCTVLFLVQNNQWLEYFKTMFGF